MVTRAVTVLWLVLTCSATAHVRANTDVASRPGQAGATDLPASKSAGPVGESMPEVDDSDVVGQARAAFEAGAAAALNGRWPQAAEAFARSLALSPRPATYNNLAVALCHIDQLVLCLEQLEAFFAVTDPERDAEARALAGDLLEQTLARVATLELHIQPVDATVVIDGRIHPSDGSGRERIRVRPGAHRVSVAADGRVPMRFSWRASAGERAQRRVDLQWPSPEPGPSASSLRAGLNSEPAQAGPRGRVAGAGVVPITLAVSAGVLLAGGAVTGWLAIRDDQRVTEACAGQNPCDRPDLVGVRDRAGTLAAVTDALWVAAAASASIALVWWLVDSRSPTSEGTSLSLAPGRVNLYARF